jgi:hypothetical protein
VFEPCLQRIAQSTEQSLKAIGDVFNPITDVSVPSCDEYNLVHVAFPEPGRTRKKNLKRFHLHSFDNI